MLTTPLPSLPLHHTRRVPSNLNRAAGARVVQVQVGGAQGRVYLPDQVSSLHVHRYRLSGVGDRGERLDDGSRAVGGEIWRYTED